MKLTDLNQRLAAKNLQGFWEMHRGLAGTKTEPYLWKWVDIYEALQLASEEVPMDKTGRRAIVLKNPNMEDGVLTNTLNVSVQLVKPGEIAQAHRHMASAIRFIIKGSRDAYTIVQGERFPMEEGDLITTPNWTWHDHYNGSSEPAIWFDGLDANLVRFLSPRFSENFSQERQPVERPDGYSSRLLGTARPSWMKPESDYPQFRYQWAETYPTLLALRESQGDPFDGIRLQYKNLSNGGPTLPTISCEVQLLRPHEKTHVHRHTSSTVYLAFRGQGVTKVDGVNMVWEQGDIFVLPPWQWHGHENPSDEDAVLFSITDSPVLKTLGFYREEAQQ